MQVSTEKIGSYEIEMTIEVDEKKFEEGIVHAYKNLAKQINIPGFRKGKVPKKVIEARFGKDVFFEDAVDYIIPQVYPQALDELDSAYEPVSRPEIEIVQLEEEKPFIFKAKIQIKPEVKLGEYKGLELVKKAIVVSEEDIQSDLAKLQERHAELVVVAEDEAIIDGDLTVIDYQGSVDGELFEGGTAEGHNLEIGSRTFIPGFEAQLIGLKKDEEKVIQVVFPEEYHAEHLAGKPADFKVKIREIKRKRLLDLDDEFAKDISDFDTLAELKEDIKQKIVKKKEDEAEGDLRVQAIKKAVEGAEFEVPPAMIDNQVEFMIRDFEYNLQTQGLSLDTFLKYTGADLDRIKEDYRPGAEQAVQENLVLDELIKAEAIEVTEEEITAELERLAGIYNQSVEMVRKMFTEGDNLEGVREGIKRNRIFAVLIDNAKITEEKAE